MSMISCYNTHVLPTRRKLAAATEFHKANNGKKVGDSVMHAARYATFPILGQSAAAYT